MDMKANWKDIKQLFKQSLNSSFHFAIASVSESGEPHVTPIGSLILGRPGEGIYFEKFTQNMPLNYASNRQICVLAVNSSKWFWLKSMVSGRFSSPPAIRLHGVVGNLRSASDKEIILWHKRVKKFKYSKGHKLIWRGMTMVREIKFTRIEPVKIGQMTRDL